MSHHSHPRHPTPRSTSSAIEGCQVNLSNSLKSYAASDPLIHHAPAPPSVEASTSGSSSGLLGFHTPILPSLESSTTSDAFDFHASLEASGSESYSGSGLLDVLPPFPSLESSAASDLLDSRALGGFHPFDFRTPIPSPLEPSDSYYAPVPPSVEASTSGSSSGLLGFHTPILPSFESSTASDAFDFHALLEASGSGSYSGSGLFDVLIPFPSSLMSSSASDLLDSHALGGFRPSDFRTPMPPPLEPSADSEPSDSYYAPAPPSVEASASGCFDFYAPFPLSLDSFAAPDQFDGQSPAPPSADLFTSASYGSSGHTSALPSLNISKPYPGSEYFDFEALVSPLANETIGPSNRHFYSSRHDATIREHWV
jgi:hypothetical protein